MDRNQEDLKIYEDILYAGGWRDEYSIEFLVRPLCGKDKVYRGSSLSKPE